jgi:DNA-binding MarR family transcriptional regulator
MTTSDSEGDGESRQLDFDRLIHEPARLVLMSNLYVVDEADFVFLTRRTGLTAGNISSHMARLEAAEYVTIEKTFADKRPRTTYALTNTGRTAFETYRQHVNALLADSSIQQ